MLQREHLLVVLFLSQPHPLKKSLFGTHAVFVEMVILSLQKIRWYLARSCFNTKQTLCQWEFQDQTWTS